MTLHYKFVKLFDLQTCNYLKIKKYILEKFFFLVTYICPRKGKRHLTFKNIFKSTIVIECVESSLSSPGTEECQFLKSPCEHMFFISTKNLPEEKSLLSLNHKRN